MAVITVNPRGTADVTPEKSAKWQFVESVLRSVSEKTGVKELRTPTFEHTELFQRGVGDTTDVVQKEMYTFLDKGDRSITLRPEGTAGAVRSFIQNGLFNLPAPVKMFYIIPCFRYEKPQAGRLREFHQYGVEFFGSASAAADAEVISLASSIFDAFDIREHISLRINSIGCKTCRQEYNNALKEYFASHSDSLCPTCLDRLNRNPMRIIDCKSPVCSLVAKDAPKILDYICEDCSAHFESLKARLDTLDISYTVDPTIVRGLDYYNRTVFEFVTEYIGAQGTVLGGGRYDPLVKELGGPDTPALGFAMGLERLILLLESMKKLDDVAYPSCRIYVGSMGEKASAFAQKVAAALRSKGIFAECDICDRSVKAQMKYADKIGAQFTAVIGDSELENGSVKLRNMADGSVTELSLSDLSEGNF